MYGKCKCKCKCNLCKGWCLGVKEAATPPILFPVLRSPYSTRHAINVFFFEL